jgi:hypothetical protein
MKSIAYRKGGMLLSTLLGMASLSTHAQVQLAFDTFQSGSPGYNNPGTPVLNTDYDRLAHPFGPDTQFAAGYQVTSLGLSSTITAGTTLEFKGALFDGPASGTPTVTVRLMSDGGDVPGSTEIASWTISSFDAVGTDESAMTIHTTTVNAGQSITASSSYWLTWEVADSSADDVARFFYGDSADNDEFAFSLEIPPSWTNLGPGPVGAFSITAVPEPHEYAAAFLAALGAFAVLRKRRTALAV